MRLLPLFIFVLAGSLAAGEPPPAYPLWDGVESVEHYARRVNLPPTQSLDLGNDITLELVLIPAGQFMMGTPEPHEPGETVVVGQAILWAGGGLALTFILLILIHAIAKRQRPKFSLRGLLLLTFAASVALYGGVRWHKTKEAWRGYHAAEVRFVAAADQEKPAHSVTISQPFYMGKYPVTQEQYLQLNGTTNPSYFPGKFNPIEEVSWDTAQSTCKKMSEQTKQTVRLPTEAEWEYACRAGTTTAYNSGDTVTDLARVAWYSANSTNKTHPVGQKEANAFGLYDMHGNVFQWCQDWYAEDYYGKSEAENPRGPALGATRMMRGGCWAFEPGRCRSAMRFWLPPDNCSHAVGFRVVVMPAAGTP